MNYELKMGERVDKWTSGQGRGKTCFASCSEINAGIACLDRADEVEPRPNEERVVMWQPKQSGARRSQSMTKNALIVRDCHVAALLAMTMSIVTEINAGIACSDRANEVEPRPNEDRARAESPKSIAQGNALCNELHLSPSSPERAKSFVNNRLRSERRYVFNPVNLVNPINHGSDNMLDWLRRAPLCFGRFSRASFAMTNRRKHSIHNYIKTKRRKPKIRNQRVGIN